MSKATLVILNPKAGSGRAGRLWPRLEPLLYQHFGSLLVAITETPAQIAQYLDQAHEAGLTRIIAVGGDGTNHAIINAIIEARARRPEAEPFILGHLPMGTGQDFARSLKIPPKPEDAIPWLARVEPHPIDLGKIELDGQPHYFLNISSVGVSGKVVERLEGVPRRPWSFYMSALLALSTYQPPVMQIRLDGELWYQGRCWLAAIANGAVFGRGMMIAPGAKVNDGLFDVVIVKEASRMALIRCFNTIYSGKHLQREEVELRRGKVVEIECLDGPLTLDLDGEPSHAQHLRFSIQPDALQMIYSGT